jgi:mono/diheme cytochrome c family protein
MATATRSAVLIVSMVLGMCTLTPLPICAAPADEATPPAEQSVAAGNALFNSVGCWSCHGFNGQGATSRGIASGPRINARVLPEAAFLQQLRSPMNVMPPYTQAVLSDGQAAAIFEYLRSLPVPRPVREIPLLEAQQQ